MSAPSLLRRGAVTLGVVAVSGVLAGCGSASSTTEAAPASVASTIATTTTTTTTTTTAPTTTTSTISTTTTTTTAPPTTTTTTTLPVPIAPPQDAYGDEPVIEVGRVEIPKLGVDMAMFEGIRLPTLDRGPGHWPGSAMPGEQGNVVVAGHRTSGHRVFRHVDQLVEGDEIVFHTGPDRVVYLVTAVEIVPPEALWIVDQTPEFTATLFACHPPGSTAERIVVHATLATA